MCATKLTFADKIVRDTAWCGECEIERYDDGDIGILWPPGVDVARLAAATGIDEELFFRSADGTWLHIPAEIAAQR